MNDLSLRPREDQVVLLNEPYRCEGWSTAIFAPKSGDFPLQMERDSYWLKSSDNNFDPFGNIFGHRPMGHESIPSNTLTIHVHALPEEGRPASFTGAIGQFTATGQATPDSAAVGDPVTLHFSVSGAGNFDYIRCPALAADPAWKTYVPSSKTTYQDESQTVGSKVFDQAVIPQKGGSLPLPAASFSYFDPTAKKYVTLPIPLPTITVIGSVAPVVAAGAPDGDGATSPAATPALAFIPNRDEVGDLRPDLTPVYRHPWFWAVQGGAVFLLGLGAVLLFVRSRSRPEEGLAERKLRERSLQEEENAMSEAARNGDTRAFFLAARHAVQLRLGGQWRMNPEAITLAEVRQRDPALAENLQPLFDQADEIIYSGLDSPKVDLTPWEEHVRELLQPQSQTASP